MKKKDEYTVLIVEDEEAIALMERKALEGAGFKTVIAENGKAALQLIESSGIDLILVDHQLPDMSSRDIIAALGERIHLLPVVVVTAHGNEQLAVEMLKSGVADYVVKDTGIKFVKLLPKIVRNQIEHWHVKEELRKSDELKRRLIESSTDCIKLLDLQGNLLFMNKGGQETFEIENIETYLNKSWLDFWTGEDYKAAAVTISNAKKGAIGTFQGYCLTAKGNPRWWDVVITPICGPEGKVEQLLTISRDITEKRKLEEERIKSQKLESIGILAGGIAHDFNNCLQGILSNVVLAMARTGPNDEVYNILAEAEKAVLPAKNLSQQLLTFSRGGGLVKKTIYIPELIKASASLALSGSNVKCLYNLSDDVLPVEADRGQLGQVINNLFINADQAMPEGGIINVNAENVNIEANGPLPLLEGRYVKITIKDQGIGISKDHLQKIFDPYFTTKHKGNGLGLAITYSIIKKHDGYINVESKMGSGTTFYIYLPASQNGVSRDPGLSDTKGKDIEETTSADGRKVLLMDDEDIIRLSVSQQLIDIKYEVGKAKNGDEAIELYKSAMESGKPFDAVILDLTVAGGMGGEETIRRLLEIDPDVKAIVASGYANDSIMSNFEKYGFRGVVAKPYEIGELVEILHKMTEGEGL